MIDSILWLIHEKRVTIQNKDLNQLKEINELKASNDKNKKENFESLCSSKTDLKYQASRSREPSEVDKSQNRRRDTYQQAHTTRNFL